MIIFMRGSPDYDDDVLVPIHVTAGSSSPRGIINAFPPVRSKKRFLFSPLFRCGVFPLLTERIYSDMPCAGGGRATRRRYNDILYILFPADH
ncbi:hypothetical protein QTP88_017887 [Uroleucon formosanum]